MAFAKTNSAPSNKGNHKIAPFKEIVKKALEANSKWPDKDVFLDVIYWARQIFGIFMGIIWGIIPLKGFIGIMLFTSISCLLVYLYAMNFQNIDEEAYGGPWELVKEGFMTSFSCFLVTWIIFYTGLHCDDLIKAKNL